MYKIWNTHRPHIRNIYNYIKQNEKSVYLAGSLYEFSLQINIKKTFTTFIEKEICKAGFHWVKVQILTQISFRSFDNLAQNFIYNGFTGKSRQERFCSYPKGGIKENLNWLHENCACLLRLWKCSPVDYCFYLRNWALERSHVHQTEWAKIWASSCLSKQAPDKRKFERRVLIV